MKKKNKIKISFVDSVSSTEVTGSNIYIETQNYKILLDCGMHQSNNKKQDYIINNRKTKEYKAKDLDYIFITHTHADHMCLLPKYYKDGFRGATLIPKGCKSIYKRMCEDSAWILQRDIELINSQENKNFLPLYGIEDVENSLDYIYEQPISEKIKVNDDLEFMFIPSGHLLNGCQLILWVTENGVTKSIAYTGDIGNPYVDNKFVGKLEKIEKCDILIGESTYGDRKDLKVRNKERENDLEKLKTIIDTQVIKMKGKVIIPVFAQCRCVQMLEFIYRLYKDDENFKYKVYVDSPLAIDLMMDLETKLDGEEKELYSNMLSWDKLNLVYSSEQSKLLVQSTEPCVCLSTSGMMVVGRIRHHFKSIVSNPNSTILFCGYSAEGSLASMLKDPKRKEIEIDGKVYTIKCASYSLKSMSGHATFEVLLDYYSNINCNKIILHHGSENAKIELSKELKKELEKKCKSTRVICANNSLKFTL